MALFLPTSHSLSPHLIRHSHRKGRGGRWQWRLPMSALISWFLQDFPDGIFKFCPLPNYLSHRNRRRAGVSGACWCPLDFL